MMKVSPDSKCVNDCVKASKDIRYTLISGKNVYALDTLDKREKAATLAGEKMRVRGVLHEKTNVIEVDSIEPAR